MKVIVCGGDGYCGWPTSLYLSHKGFEIVILDNLSRRKIDVELGSNSLTPISTLDNRIRTWNAVSGRKPIRHVNIDLANEGERLANLIREEAPDAILHYAEQRAAPFSMKSSGHKRYTLSNNLLATFNLLESIVGAEKDIHFIHLGSMGVYGYFSRNSVVPEGYLDIGAMTGDDNGNGNGKGNGSYSDKEKNKSSCQVDILKKRFLCQGSPASLYHCTKMQDAILFQFYNANDNIRITDLHQGVVWGTHTDQTRMHDDLINRFDYDGDYGTFINRFLLQSVIGHPITLYGKGGQCRPIIHIRDSMQCVELSLNNPPKKGDAVHIYNQTTETYQIRDIAELVSQKTGTPIKHVPNPRVENEEVRYKVDNSTLLYLGLKPTFINDMLMEEVMDVARKYSDRCSWDLILPRSKWRKDIELAGAVEEPDFALHPSPFARMDTEMESDVRVVETAH